MDPITLILTSLAAGASATLNDTAGQAIKDAYVGLKSLLKRKFGGRLDGDMILEKHEQKPEVWREPLKEELTEAGADQDEEIVRAAHELAKLVDPGTARAFEQHIVNYGAVGQQFNIGQVGEIGSIGAPSVPRVPQGKED